MFYVVCDGLVEILISLYLEEEESHLLTTWLVTRCQYFFSVYCWKFWAMTVFACVTVGHF